MIHAENLSLGFGEKLLFKDLSFSLKKGKVLAVLGPNGAGKTSLIRALCNFIGFDRGRVILKGKDLRTYKKNDLWKIISYVPQKASYTFDYKGLDMLALGLYPRLGPFEKLGDRAYMKAENLLKELKIYDLKDKPLSKMSGGEAQMLIIARALISEPELLILDEPESGLDFKNQLRILDILKNLADHKAMTIIINTHYPENALRLADKTLIIKDGGDFIFGNTSEVIREKNLEEVFKVKVAIRDIKVGEKIIKSVTAYKD